MAGGAGLLGAMLLELLADRLRSANIWFDGWRIRRGRGYGLAEDTFHHPGATEDGRGGSAVGCDLENAGLGQETRRGGNPSGRAPAQRYAFERREAVMRPRAVR